MKHNFGTSQPGPRDHGIQVFHKTTDANLPAFSCKDWTMPLATLKVSQTSGIGASFMPECK
jgi:hypothetical protein